MAQPDRLDSGRLLLIGIAVVVVVYFFIVGTEVAVVYIEQREAETKIYPIERQEVATLKEQHAREITGYKYIDRDKGIVQLDIDRAKELVARRVASAHATDAAMEGREE